MTAKTAAKVTAQRVTASSKELLVPGSKAWKDVAETAVALSPTPLDAQPSAYVRASWADRPHGKTGTVNVSAVVADDALFIRLRWETAEPHQSISDNNVYADACAVLFPADGKGAELATMGDEKRPVQAWHWRAGTALPFVVTATGLGTTERAKAHPVSVGAAWEGGSWSVAFRRDLGGKGVPLAAGASVPIGLAVWQGANNERAGIKSHTPDWLTLELPK